MSTESGLRAALSRRTFLAGAAALAAPLVPWPVCASAPHRVVVGAIKVLVVSDGTLSVPLSFTLPETPREDAERLMAANGLPPGGEPHQTNVSLVQTGNELVLIDAGAGANFQATAGKLADNLEAAGVERTDITKIVFTHGHADHLWGAIDDFDDSERFPNARYVIPAAEWDFWTDPGTAERVPDWLKGMARGSARILRRLEPKLERRRPGDEVAPGLTYMDTAGHTPGHVSVLVASDDEHLLIGGDALTHAAISFQEPAWRIGTDFDRDQAVRARTRLLDQLATDRLALIGFHLPWPGHGLVERKDTAYRFVPA